MPSQDTNIKPASPPLVSVLIPCYNAAAHIAETIDSVIAQTYTHWECIVVDDHSTDNSTEIVQSYCDKYPEKIKLYTNPRKGACAARNVAFENCRGEYIQYLDADDLLSNDKMINQISLLNCKGNIITACKWVRFFTEKSEKKAHPRFIDKNYNPAYKWLIDSWNGKGMNQTSVWLTPRTLIKKAGPWNEALKINQDGEFFCRVLLNASELIFDDNSLVYYRTGITSSITGKKKDRDKYENLFYSFDCCLKYCERSSFSNELSKALGACYYRLAIDTFPLYKGVSSKSIIKAKTLNTNGYFETPVLGGSTIELTKKLFGWKFARLLAFYSRHIRNIFFTL